MARERLATGSNGFSLAAGLGAMAVGNSTEGCNDAMNGSGGVTVFGADGKRTGVPANAAGEGSKISGAGIEIGAAMGTTGTSRMAATSTWTVLSGSFRSARR